MKFSPDNLNTLLSAYRNPKLIEFEEDLTRIVTISRLLKKYGSSGNTNAHLLVNYMVVSYNLFGQKFTEIMQESVDEDTNALLNSLLFFMGRDTREPMSEDFLNYLQDNVK